MADKNFIVKNGLEVGGQEVVSSSGVVTSAALGGQTLASTDSPTFNNLTLTNDIAVGGDLNLTGDLNITGDVNSLSVTDLDVTDQTITLGAGQVESASGGSGIIVDGSNASILWDETNTEWDFNNSINVTGTVVSDGLTVDGETFSSNGTYGTKLTYSNGNQSGVIDTFGNHNLEFRANNDRAMNIAANGDISFYEDTGTTAKLFWDASEERLGIGTTIPAYKLHVEHNQDASTPIINIVNDNTGTSSAARLYFDADGNNFSIYNWGDATSKANATEFNSTAGGSYFIFSPSNTEAMRIDSSGNVGIGTSSLSDFSANANNLVVGSGSGTEGITINSGTANYGVIYFADGTSGSAAYAGNINYNHADNSMRLGTNGSTTDVVIDSSGNVGIGTTSPAAGLQVSKGLTNAGGPAAGASTAAACFGNEGSDDNYGLVLGADGFGDGYISAQRTDGTATTYDLFIQPNGGNVGIGTTNPFVKLHVANDGSGEADVARFSRTNGADLGFLDITINPDADEAIYDASGSVALSHVFRTGGTERLRITSSGNVGIGTSNPSSFNAAGTGIATVSGAGTGASTFALYSDTTSSGYLYFSDGTSGADRYRGYVEYSHANNDMRIGTASTERIRIDSSGNVGIGTTPPSGVRTKIKGLAEATNLATSATSAALFIEPYSGSSWGLGIGSISGQKQYIQGVSAAGDSSRELLINPYGGNVGIGTDSAVYAFHIHHPTPRIQLKDTSSSGEAYLQLDGVAVSLANKATNGPLYLSTNNPREEFVYINGTAFYSESFNLNNGVQYDFDIDVPDEGGYGNSFFIIAGYAHNNASTYAAHTVKFVATRSTGLATIMNIGDQTSTGGGAWQISKADNTTLRLRKTAGTYVGAGSGFITVIFRNAIG
jgi:hypothetical protein